MSLNVNKKKNGTQEHVDTGVGRTVDGVGEHFERIEGGYEVKIN